MDHVLTLLIVIPIAGIVPLILFFRDARAVKQVAVVTTFIELVVSLVALAQFHVGEAGFQLVESAAWLPSFGIRYELGVDGISILLIPMTTLLTFISVLYSSGGAIKERVGEFMAAGDGLAQRLRIELTDPAWCEDGGLDAVRVE